MFEAFKAGRKPTHVKFADGKEGPLSLLSNSLCCFASLLACFVLRDISSLSPNGVMDEQDHPPR